MLGVIAVSVQGKPSPPPACPTDGVEPQRKTAVVAELSWAVGRFLQELGQTHEASRTFSALLAFLQASYPLPLSSQLLLVRVLERLGTIAYASGDKDSAASHYHQALRVTFDLDVMEEDLCDHRQVDTFKGVCGYECVCVCVRVWGDVVEG